MPTFRFSFNPRMTYVDPETGERCVKPEFHDETRYKTYPVGDDLIEYRDVTTDEVVARCRVIKTEAESNLIEEMGYQDGDG